MKIKVYKFKEDKQLFKESAINKLKDQIKDVSESLESQLLNKINRFDESEAQYILDTYGDSFAMMLYTQKLSDPHPKIKKLLSKFKKDIGKL